MDAYCCTSCRVFPIYIWNGFNDVFLWRGSSSHCLLFNSAKLDSKVNPKQWVDYFPCSAIPVFHYTFLSNLLQSKYNHSPHFLATFIVQINKKKLRITKILTWIIHLILLGHSGVVLQSLVYDDMKRTESDYLGAQKPEYALMYSNNWLISGRK